MQTLSIDQQLDLIKRSLDELPRGILITDCQQKDDPIVYANQGFLNMSGYDMHEIIGKNCRFMQGDESDDETQKKLAVAIQNREPVTVTILNYRKNGEKFWNEFTVRPVKNQDGAVTHMIALERELDKPVA